MLKIISYGGFALNDGVNYRAGFSPGMEWGLPAVQAQVVQRVGAWPLVTGVQRPGAVLTLVVQILRDVAYLREQLLRALSPEDETPKPLVIADVDGGRQRYVNAVVESIVPQVAGKAAAAAQFVVQMRVHGDVRWRAVTATSSTWNITASGQTRLIVNPGSDEAYPVFRIKPTSVKSGGYAYRRWVAVVWRSPNSATRYPVRIDLDTQTLVSGGKMQADGDDLRVVVDGVESDRWLADMNTTATGIWVNLDFAPAVAMTLRTAIPSSGSIASIEVNEDISRMPESGILLIDSEAFVYTAKVNSERKFTDITRAAKGTNAAAHAAGTAVHWVQRDLWLLYGNPSATAPAIDNRYRPAFSLSSSTNSVWIYTEFNDSDLMRSGGWRPTRNITLTGTCGCYTATERALAPGEFGVIGAWVGENASPPANVAGWVLGNPCGIVNVAWGNGKKRRAGENFLVHCMNWVRKTSSWSWHYDLPRPKSTNVWESWSYSGSPFDVSDQIAIAAYYYPQDVEVGDVTVTLNASETPMVLVGEEQGGYYLDCVIENTTTGDAIRLTFAMTLNTELEVDCDRHTVRWLADKSNQLAALQVLGTSRRHWLRLAPGGNTLRFTDAGTTGVTLTTIFEARYL